MPIRVEDYERLIERAPQRAGEFREVPVEQLLPALSALPGMALVDAETLRAAIEDDIEGVLFRSVQEAADWLLGEVEPSLTRAQVSIRADGNVLDLVQRSGQSLSSRNAFDRRMFALGRWSSFDQMEQDEFYREQSTIYARMINLETILNASNESLRTSTAGEQGSVPTDQEIDAFLVQARQELQSLIGNFSDSEAVDVFLDTTSEQWLSGQELDASAVASEEVSNSEAFEAGLSIILNDDDLSARAFEWFRENRDRLESEFISAGQPDFFTWYDAEVLPPLEEFLLNNQPITGRDDPILAGRIREALGDFPVDVASGMVNTILQRLDNLSWQTGITDKNDLWDEFANTFIDGGAQSLRGQTLLGKTVDDWVRQRIQNVDGGSDFLAALDASRVSLVQLWRRAGAAEAVTEEEFFTAIRDAAVESGLPGFQVSTNEQLNVQDYVESFYGDALDDVPQYLRGGILQQIISDLEKAGLNPLRSDNIGRYESALEQLNFDRLAQSVIEAEILAVEGGEDLVRQLREQSGGNPQAFLEAFDALGIDPDVRFRNEFAFAIADLIPASGESQALGTFVEEFASLIPAFARGTITSDLTRALSGFLTRNPLLDEQEAIVSEEFRLEAESVIESRLRSILPDDDVTTALLDLYGSATEFFENNPQFKEQDIEEILRAIEQDPVSLAPAGADTSDLEAAAGRARQLEEADDVAEQARIAAARETRAALAFRQSPEGRRIAAIEREAEALGIAGGVRGFFLEEARSRLRRFGLTPAVERVLAAAGPEFFSEFRTFLGDEGQLGQFVVDEQATRPATQADVEAARASEVGQMLGVSAADVQAGLAPGRTTGRLGADFNAQLQSFIERQLTPERFIRILRQDQLARTQFDVAPAIQVQTPTLASR